MRDLIEQQLAEVRSNLGRLGKRLKAATRVAGKGACKVSATLGTINLKLAGALEEELHGLGVEDTDSAS